MAETGHLKSSKLPKLPELSASAARARSIPAPKHALCFGNATSALDAGDRCDGSGLSGNLCQHIACRSL